MSILNSKTKTPKTNLSARRIVALHIHHLICGVRDYEFEIHKEPVWKYVYFESYPSIFTTSSRMYKVLFESMSILKQKHQKQFIHQENRSLAYSPRCTYEFEIHKGLFESMSILNSKTKTPKTIHPQGASYPCIFTTSSGCTGVTNLKFTRSCLKVCLFWIQKQKHQKQFIRQENRSLAYSPPHAVYGSYEFEIFLVLLKNMSVLNSKTKTPKTIHPPGES